MRLLRNRSLFRYDLDGRSPRVGGPSFDDRVWLKVRTKIGREQARLDAVCKRYHSRRDIKVKLLSVVMQFLESN